VPTILTHAAVSNTETERKAQEIIYAFYAFFFINTARTLAGAQVTFPALAKENYLFNQQQAQPLAAGPQIHTIFTDLRPLQIGQDNTNKLIRNNAILTIYIRVANPSDGMQSADFECRFWSDALKQIFESGTQALAQLGIHHTKIRRGPIPVPAAGTQTRMLVVTAQLQYTVKY
jgi:hypothetical protein